MAENAQVIEGWSEKLNALLRNDLNLNNFQTKRNHIFTLSSEPGF